MVTLWQTISEPGPSLNFRMADELDTICGQANSAAIERPVRQNSTPRDGRGASCWVRVFLYCGYILMLQKNPESESVRDQQ
jgi:hypothetical protein